MRKRITLKVAQKVLEVVDAGLSRGVGAPKPGHMCVEAAVCYAMGEPHNDAPRCVDDELRTLKIELNDMRGWKTKASRAKGLRRLAIAQLGSVDKLNIDEFYKGLDEICNKLKCQDFPHPTHGNVYDYTDRLWRHCARLWKSRKAREPFLMAVCEEVVQLLIKLKVPGTKFLYLTE